MQKKTCVPHNDYLFTRFKIFFLAISRKHCFIKY